MKTIEELKAELAIHQATGATRKCAIIEDQIAKLSEEFKKDPEIKTEPVEQIAYEMKQKGHSWAEIKETTGLKAPHMTVKKYAKDSNLPYDG